jgi:hypothetical protein
MKRINKIEILREWAKAKIVTLEGFRDREWAGSVVAGYNVVIEEFREAIEKDDFATLWKRRGDYNIVINCDECDGDVDRAIVFEDCHDEFYSKEICRGCLTDALAELDSEAG